jgi:hypothetical protein
VKEQELLVCVKSTRRTIPKKLGLDGEPQDPSRGTTLGDRVGEIVVMVLVSQVRTTQSILTQSGEMGAAASGRTWCSRENFARVRRKDSPPGVEGRGDVEE